LPNGHALVCLVVGVIGAALCCFLMMGVLVLSDAKTLLYAAEVVGLFGGAIGFVTLFYWALFVLVVEAL